VQGSTGVEVGDSMNIVDGVKLCNKVLYQLYNISSTGLGVGVRCIHILPVLEYNQSSSPVRLTSLLQSAIRLERCDLLWVVSASVELFEERLRWGWVFVALEPM
jgi:hypothetical protein